MSASNNKTDSSPNGPPFMAKFIMHLATKTVGGKQFMQVLKKANDKNTDFSCYWRTKIFHPVKSKVPENKAAGDSSSETKQKWTIVFLDVSFRFITMTEEDTPSVSISLGALLQNIKDPSIHYFVKAKPLSLDTCEEHFLDAGIDLVSSPPEITAASLAKAFARIGTSKEATQATSNRSLENNVLHVPGIDLSLPLYHVDYDQSAPMPLESCSVQELKQDVVDSWTASLQVHDDFVVETSQIVYKKESGSKGQLDYSGEIKQAFEKWWEDSVHACRAREALNRAAQATGGAADAEALAAAAAAAKPISRPTKRMATVKPVTGRIRLPPPKKKKKGTIYATDSDSD